MRPRSFGRFQLLERVAVGGMAEIFLAAERQSYGGWRFVTIKRIRPDCNHPDYHDFFMTEARVSLQCSHPNIPQVYEVGESEGQLYLAMEYIRGHTLLSFLQSINKDRQATPVPVAVTIAFSVAAALEHVHELRSPEGHTLEVIHRDVTPQNVMVSAAGAVKLIDFGIVRSAIQIHETQAGVVKGKFGYMAPETIASPRDTDPRADLFALGVMMHEMLSGRPLFRGHNEADTMERVRRLPIPDLTHLRADIPPEITAVVERLLARDPDHRYQSATHLLGALEAATTLCHVPITTVGLRDAFHAACGEPTQPVFDGTVYSTASEARVRQRMALGSDSDANAHPETVRARHATRRPDTGDEELSYFLSRAGLDADEFPASETDS
ncbi:MAG: serine/threonine protein kinase [Deltaproteobacteria bacterium]|nr:serine/threonine protein kinase [Deltaproteobacteria bacterium]